MTRRNNYKASSPANSNSSTPLRVNTPRVSSDIIPTSLDPAQLSGENRQLFNCIVQYFESKLAERDQKIVKLEGTVDELRSRMNHLEEQVDGQDSYGRRETLIVSGNVPIARDGENCGAIVRDIVKRTLNINMKDTDISVAHRIGRIPRTGGSDTRSIIFKLCRRDLKRDIVSACKGSKLDVYFNDSLTPTRSTIMFVLRKARREFPNNFGNCRSTDGNVSVWLPTDQAGKYRRVGVNSRRALDELLDREVSRTSSNYVDNWP